MNQVLFRATRPSAGACMLATAALFAAGCGNDNFAKVNGQVITKDEYMRALERAPVSIQGGQQNAQISAGRFVLDQIIGKKVVLAEASKESVLPQDAEVDKRFDVQKRLFEAQGASKSFADWMKEQGVTDKDLKEELRSQLAEVSLLAKRMNLSEDQLKKAYEERKDKLGLPERAQLRVIVASAGSREFSDAQKMLAGKTGFEAVARQINPPMYRTTGGMLPQAIPFDGMPLPWRERVRATKEGSHFGPIDWPMPVDGKPAKSWLQVVKRMPDFKLTYEDAKPFLKQQLVQEQMVDPKNAQQRQRILSLKMDAKFESDDPKYKEIWQSVKDAAKPALSSEGATAPPISALPGPGG